jgi:hypothetical protein
MITCGKPDDDGDTRLEAHCVVRNVGDVELEKVMLRLELVDEDGAVIDNSESSAEINVGSVGHLEPSLWSVSPANLKHSTVRLALSVFTPVATAKATASGVAAAD